MIVPLRRVLDMLLMLSLGAVLLAACGDDGGSSGSTNNATSNGSSGTSDATSNSTTGTSSTTGGTTDTGGQTNNGTTGGATTSNTSNATTPYMCDVMTTGNFVPADSDTCDLFAQDCANGQACFLAADGAQCFDPGLLDCGQVCEFLNDCQHGQLCAGDPPRCLAMCEPGNDCPGSALCAGLSDRDNVGVCVPNAPVQACSLQAQDCPDDQACYLINGSSECSPPTADAGGLGEACMFANGCEPGLICVGVDADNLNCRRPCLQSDPSACAAEETCQPLASDGGDDGVCVTP